MSQYRNEYNAIDINLPFGKLLVLSEVKAEKFQFYTNWAAISITNPGSDFAALHTENRVDILQLKFYDLTVALGPYKELFTTEHAQQIWKFVDKIWNRVELLLIQCQMGISRSAAVAAAISKEYDGNDNYFFDNYIPNFLVYKTLLQTKNNPNIQ